MCTCKILSHWLWNKKQIGICRILQILNEDFIRNVTHNIVSEFWFSLQIIHNIRYKLAKHHAFPLRIFITVMSFVKAMFLHCLTHNLVDSFSPYISSLPLTMKNYQISYGDFSNVMGLSNIFLLSEVLGTPRTIFNVIIRVFSCRLQLKKKTRKLFHIWLCIETSEVSYCEFWIFWVTVNTKFCHKCLFCFYTHPVNSKFAKWQMKR